MLTGIEAAGLALAIIPVVVEILDFYSGSLTSRDVSFLAESLRNKELIFKNTVEELLNSVLSKTELRKLLEDPRGPLWTDDGINSRVADHLGAEASGLFEVAKEIHSTVHDLKAKLPTLARKGTADPKLLPRVKQVIKAFCHGPQNRASLKKLKASIDDFATLTGQSLRLTPQRHALPDSLRNLKHLQERARGLYAALREGWQCDCSHLHPANLRLEVWQSQPKDSRHDSFRFRLLFVFATNTEDGRSDHWKAAEIIPIDGGEKRQHLAITNITGDPYNTESHSQRADKLLQQTPSERQLATPRVKFQLPEPTGQSRSAKEIDERRSDITDLCTLLSSLQNDSPSESRCLGYISDDQDCRYGIFTTAASAPSSSATSSTYLGEIFSRPSRKPDADQKSLRDAPKFATLKNSDRAQLALMLGWNALQLHSTHWLEDHLTKDNILLVVDPPNIFQPYVTHHFQSLSRRNSRDSNEVTLITGGRDRLTLWVPNEALFTLGIVLIEICYDKSIEELAIDAEKDKNGKPHSLTGFLTAMRLSNEVQEQLGLRYASAVRGCLLCNFGRDQIEPDLSSEQFQTSVWQHIIKPLEDVARIFPKNALTTVVA